MALGALALTDTIVAVLVGAAISLLGTAIVASVSWRNAERDREARAQQAQLDRAYQAHLARDTWILDRRNETYVELVLLVREWNEYAHDAESYVRFAMEHPPTWAVAKELTPTEVRVQVFASESVKRMDEWQLQRDSFRTAVFGAKSAFDYGGLADGGKGVLLQVRHAQERLHKAGALVTSTVVDDLQDTQAKDVEPVPESGSFSPSMAVEEVAPRPAPGS